MKIRTFVAADKLSVVQLWHRCALVVPWNNPDKDIERKRAVGSELFLVGEISGIIVASAMGGYDGHRGWVNYMAVDPKQQRKGLALQMMKEIENRLITLGCPKLNLQIRASNTSVIAFYQALGFNQDACVSLGKRLISDD